MSWLKKVFGGGGNTPAAAKTPAEEHKGFAITPAPIKEAGGYRVCAMIEKDGQTHKMVRADTISDHEAAISTSLFKAKALIDEQGTRIFAPRD
jgi:hypothetical protein